MASTQATLTQSPNCGQDQVVAPSVNVQQESQQQPASSAPVVQPVRYRFAYVPHEQDVSVASYNILAHKWLIDGVVEYGAAKYLGDWDEVRRPRIERALLELGTDVICLQECEIDTHAGDFAALKEAGYACVVQDHKKRRDNHTTGNVTWFRTDMFELVYEESRSRSLITGLRMRSWPEYRVPIEGGATAAAAAAAAAVASPEHEPKKPLKKRKKNKKNAQPKKLLEPGGVLHVVNVHLQGDPYSPHMRVSQLTSSLKSVRKRHLPYEHQQRVEDLAILVIGDFNSETTGGCTKYLLSGELEAGFEEYGKPCTKKDIKHQYSFGTAFPDVSGMTTFAAPQFSRSVVDHIIFNQPAMELVDVVGPPALREGETLPNQEHPSDHLPIQATLRLRWVTKSPPT